MSDANEKRKYIAYVGCFTYPHQADPFLEKHGGVPHDDSKVGQGIIALGVSSDGKLSYLNTAVSDNKNQDEEVAAVPIPVVSADITPNPAYLTIIQDAKHSYLCVVSEVPKEGKIFVFSIDHNLNTKNLIQVGESQSTNGSFPCHINEITLHSKRYLFASNYGATEEGASVAVFEIDNGSDIDTTKVTPLQHIPANKCGSGGDSQYQRQVSSHMHCCVGTGNDDVIVTDLGTDSVIQYTFDDSHGQLVEVGRLAMPLGSGPRSIALNPNPEFKNIAAISLEMAAQVMLVRRRDHDGCLEALRSPVSILPSEWPGNDDLGKFNHGKWASDVAWTHDGQYLFAAARLHNSISVFNLAKIERSFQLEFVHRISTGGITPRCLDVVPGDGDLLLVSHQHSHDVSSYHIDKATGMLTFVDRIEVPLAASVKSWQNNG